MWNWKVGAAVLFVGGVLHWFIIWLWGMILPSWNYITKVCTMGWGIWSTHVISLHSHVWLSLQIWWLQLIWLEWGEPWVPSSLTFEVVLMSKIIAWPWHVAVKNLAALLKHCPESSCVLKFWIIGRTPSFRVRRCQKLITSSDDVRLPAC